jgi:hypothetical protein
VEWIAGGAAPSVALMKTVAARAPEDLDTLLEDAFVLRDGAALSSLFADGAVMAHRASTPPIDRHEASMTQGTHQLAPVVTRSGDGEARWWFACLAEVKATAEQTGGLLSILQITEPPNAAGPLHVHPRPPPSDEEPDWEHVAAVAKANGCELLA